VAKILNKRILWARYAPDHSHDLADRYFSWAEGIFNDPAHHGCMTIWEQLSLLREKHNMSAYAKTQLNLNYHLSNHDFDAFYAGFVKKNEIKQVTVPLVWSYDPDPVTGEVRVHYKHNLTDTGSFARSEWGPWKNVWVDGNNLETGAVERIKVLRTDPLGVDMMHGYPDLDAHPGFEPYLDRDSWSAERVFHDVNKWAFQKNGDEHRKSWAELKQWMSLNRDAHAQLGAGHVSIPIGETNRLPTNSPPWAQMWAKLASVATPLANPAPPIPANGTSALVIAPPPAPTVGTVAVDRVAASTARKGGRPDRANIAASDSLAALNVVTNPNFTHADARQAHLTDSFRVHLRDSWHTKKKVWFVRMPHLEGELAVGLGVRTFVGDDVDGNMYQFRWYERKAKGKTDSWGKSPGFKWAIGGYEGRKALPDISTEPFDQLIPVVVEMQANDKLSMASMAALRAWSNELDNCAVDNATGPIAESEYAASPHEQSDRSESESSEEVVIYKKRPRKK